MFGLGKKKNPASSEAPEDAPSLIARLRQGLSRTRANLTDALGDLLQGRRQIDDDLLEDLETLLLTSDVGVDATRRIIRLRDGRIEADGA